MTPEETPEIVPSTPAPSTAPLFYAVSTRKLILLSIATFGIYEILWQYRNWKIIAELDNRKISPFWRAVFSIFYILPLFRRMEEEAKKQGYPEEVKATTWGVIYILISVLAGMVGKISVHPELEFQILADVLYFVGTFTFISFYYMQKPLVFINKKVQQGWQVPEIFSVPAIVITVVGLVIYCLGYLPTTL